MKLARLLSYFLGFVMVVAAVGAIALWIAYEHFAQGLPDYYKLAEYDPPVTTRVYAGDGRLLAEYAVENRVFVPVSAIPKHVINAFLAAEDKTFYSHAGIDIPGVIKAAITNFQNMGSDKRPIGASTITQQVAKNFLLEPDEARKASYKRKIKEAILALRIERAFTKDRILELYLNQIYLGAGNYGVASAALNYFNKSLDELTIGEAAYLAALPKAPNDYNLKRHADAAKARRDWVVDRMLDNGDVTREEASAAKAEQLVARARGETERFSADYFAEEVRRELIQAYQDKGLYQGGLVVRATIDPKLQEIADRVLRRGLVSYDRTRGYRGPLQHLESVADWKTEIAKIEPMPWLYEWQLAIVLEAGKDGARIGLHDGSEGQIPVSELTWAKGGVNSADDVLKVGDVIAVEGLIKEGQAVAGQYTLRQIPEVSGAFVAMDPHTGRVLALSGGWSYQQSEFNRATQALRQPGSAFKPIVYLSALEAGYTPSTMILDAPIVIDQGPGLPLWRPENYAQDYLGPTTMRRGLENSRNLMTIRMAQTIGMAKVADMTGRLGVTPNLQQTLAMSIGAGETTVLNLTAAYGMIVNGGKQITPTFIDRIQDNQGWTIYRHDNRACDGCLRKEYAGEPRPEIPDTRKQVLDPAIAYQMVSMMEGVVLRGTGTAVRAVGKPLGGKTGTTNDSRDVWFVGFSPDLVAGVYLGYDQPRTLGKKATGGKFAAPIFRDFMMEALKDKPATPFRVPPGIRLVRVNLATGERAQPGDEKVILEAFKPGTEPTGYQSVIEGIANYGEDAGYGSIIPLGPELGFTEETSAHDGQVIGAGDGGGFISPDEPSGSSQSGTGGFSAAPVQTPKPQPAPSGDSDSGLY